MRLCALRLEALMVLLIATLSACGPSREARPELGPAANPVVERVETTRLVCPDELSQDPGTPPAVPEGAVIRGNDLGLRFVRDQSAFGVRVLGLFRDAAAACAAEAALAPAAAPH